MRRAAIAAILVAIPALAVSLAIAQPSGQAQSRADARTEALARRTARAAAVQAAMPGTSGGEDFVTTLPSRGFREAPFPTPGEQAAAAGCADGTLLWRRDHGAVLCASVCVDDADCAGDERCRVVETRTTGPHAIELAEEAQTADDDEAENVRLCDPFWDAPGPVSATGL